MHGTRVSDGNMSAMHEVANLAQYTPLRIESMSPPMRLRPLGGGKDHHMLLTSDSCMAMIGICVRAVLGGVGVPQQDKVCSPMSVRPGRWAQSDSVEESHAVSRAWYCSFMHGLDAQVSFLL